MELKNIYFSYVRRGVARYQKVINISDKLALRFYKQKIFLQIQLFLILINLGALINARSISQEFNYYDQKSDVIKPSSWTTTNQYKDFVQRSLNPMDMISRNGFVHQKVELKRKLEMKKSTKSPPTTSTTHYHSIPDSHFTSFQSWGPVGK